MHLKRLGADNKISEYRLLYTIIDIYNDDKITTPTTLNPTFPVYNRHMFNEMIVTINSQGKKNMNNTTYL